MSELFGSASDYSSSGIDSLADAQYSYDENRGQTVFDNQAEEAIQNVLANVGKRSNVIGSVGYDPRFAQALNLSRGLIAGNKFDNQGNRVKDLSVPSYLQPQLFGDRVDARGEAIRYYSPVERYLQETAPRQIQNLREVSPVGIMQNLIDYGTRKFNEVFTDDKKEEKSDVGIMENMDRAEGTDLQRALRFGYENNPFSGPATQTAFKLQDVLTSPGMINRGVQFVQPYLQQVVPEGVKVDTTPLINREEGTASPQIKFIMPIEDNTLGLGGLFRNLG